MGKFNLDSLNNTKLRLIVILFVGVVLALLSIIFPIIPVLGKDIKTVFILNIGLAFIAASIIALILQVPSLLDDVNNASIKLLQDNEYLKRLSISELQNLRTLATEYAYLKTTNSPNRNLNIIDNKIGNLFLEPYFKSYDIIIRCEIVNGNIVKKEISTNFVLKNPRKESINWLQYIKPRVTQKKIDGKEFSEIRVLKSIEIMKDDDKEYKNYKDRFKLKFDEYSDEYSNYNLSSSIIPINEPDNELLSFNDSLHIRMKEERMIDKSDKVYIRRVVNPVEKFSINYSFKSDNIDLVGTGFGSFQDTKDGGINIVKDSNSINIMSNKWLLTGNGIIIVHNFGE